MGGLIIDPAVLADIRAQCQRRAAELERTEALRCSPHAPGLARERFATADVPPPIPEAERFAAAVQTMPARVAIWRMMPKTKGAYWHDRPGFVIRI